MRDVFCVRRVSGVFLALETFGVVKNARQLRFSKPHARNLAVLKPRTNLRFCVRFRSRVGLCCMIVYRSRVSVQMHRMHFESHLFKAWLLAVLQKCKNVLKPHTVPITFPHTGKNTQQTPYEYELV